MRLLFCQIILYVIVFGQTGFTNVCYQDQLPPSLRKFIADEQGFQAFQTPSWRKVPNLTAWQTPYATHLKATFPIKGCWIPEEDFKSMGGEVLSHDENLRQQFYRSSSEQEEFLFFTHPEDDTQNEYRRNGYNPDLYSCEEYCATPTSSNRTLLVWKPTQAEPETEFRPIFLKLSISSNGLKNKAVTNEEAHRSVSASDMLTAQQKSQKSFSDTFKFFKEPLAMTFKPENAQGDFANGAGFIVREVPSELFDPSKHIVSAFTLYGSPTSHDGPEPYLLKTLKKSPRELVETIQQKIIQPFVKQLLTAILEWNFVPEAHGQNLLLELDSLGNPTGIFWHRDLDGFEFSSDHRKLSGLPLSSHNFNLKSNHIHSSIYGSFNLLLSQMTISIQEWEQTLGVRAISERTLESLLYRELFKQLLETIQKRYGIKRENNFPESIERTEIEHFFKLYADIFAKFMDIFSLDQFVTLNNYPTEDPNTLINGKELDFWALYDLGFRFDKAINMLQEKLDGDCTPQQRSLWGKWITNMRKRPDHY